MSVIDNRKKVTTQSIMRMKSRGEKITALTAYDYFVAGLLDKSGIDILLVGDSAANVVHGHKTTLPITMELMIGHTAAVARGSNHALVVSDMPFLSFQPSVEVAITNAGRFLKEGNAEAVKIEGGLEMVDTVRRVIECGIPVMGHIGLTPQSINRFGGPRVQGRKDASHTYLKESALGLQEAGCFSIVLELVEKDVAAGITESLDTAAIIGIGAGAECDGQVLVTNDILGLRESGFKPRFLREYASLSPIITDAVERYISDVKDGNYPNDEESFGK